MMYPIKIGIIGGSGLDDPNILQNVQSKSVSTPFGNPSDLLLEGTIEGVECVFIARHGRKHNINPTNVNFRANIWALKESGCTHVIASSACGSLKENIIPGDIVIPDSFIDMTKYRETTFYNNKEPFPKKVVHIPMEPSFCNEVRKIFIESAKNLNIKCHDKGTAVVIEGPRFSSLAESKLFRSWDADLVNMTIVPEVILAKEIGLCYGCIAMATDFDCWHQSEASVNVENVEKIFYENVEKIKGIILHSIRIIASQNWDDTINELKRTIESSIQSKDDE